MFKTRSSVAVVFLYSMIMFFLVDHKNRGLFFDHKIVVNRIPLTRALWIIFVVVSRILWTRESSVFTP